MSQDELRSGVYNNQMLKNIVKVALLQGIWYILVKFGTSHNELILWIGVILLAWINFFLCSIKLSKKTYLALLIFFSLNGFIHDGALMKLNILSFESSHVPLWMNSLWILFLCYFDLFSYLKEKLLLCIIFALIGAPFTYWSGTQLASVEVHSLSAFILFVGVYWAFFFPVALRLYYKNWNKG